METIPEKFTTNGYRFERLDRTGMIALFRRYKPGGSDTFELVRIRVADASQIYGRDYPEREVYPGAEKWGTDGFTLTSEKEARKRFTVMSGEATQL